MMHAKGTVVGCPKHRIVRGTEPAAVGSWRLGLVDLPNHGQPKTRHDRNNVLVGTAERGFDVECTEQEIEH